MNRQYLDVVTVTQGRGRLAAIIVLLAVLALLVGLAIGRSSAPQPSTATNPAGESAPPPTPGFVAMTPAALAATGIRLETVSEGSLAAEIVSQATVTAPPEGSALLAARADGAVARIAKRLGDPVRAGETVALLESREAAAFVAERNAAAARALAARAAAARERRLFNERITARQDLEAADAARAQADAELQRAQAAVVTAGVTGNGRYLAVRSPIAGRITKSSAQLGAYVTAGAELFQVSDPRRIQIEAAVPSIDAQRIVPGDPAIIELPGGAQLEAIVRSATPSLNLESRAATIVLQPSGTPEGLTQGQSLRVRITPRGSTTTGIVLPEEAVQQVGGREVVFVRVRNGFKAVPVTVGGRSAGRVQIVEGLRPGMIVATTGAFALKSQLGAGEAES